MIYRDEYRAQIRLIGTMRNFCGEIASRLSRELLQLVALATNLAETVLPHFVIDRVACWRPIVVRPFQILTVIRILEEIEEIVLCNPKVLNQIPWRVWQSFRPSSAKIHGQVFQRVVETEMSLLPIKRRRD